MAGHYVPAAVQIQFMFLGCTRTMNSADHLEQVRKFLERETR
jgi:hypothetical protein